MTVDFGSADSGLSQTLHGEYPLLSSDDAEDRLCPAKGFAPRLSLHPAPGTLRKYNVFCFSLPSTKISLTQKQMSAICNIKERSYQNYEGGDRIPRLDDLIALATSSMYRWTTWWDGRIIPRSTPMFLTPLCYNFPERGGLL